MDWNDSSDNGPSTFYVLLTLAGVIIVFGATVCPLDMIHRETGLLGGNSWSRSSNPLPRIRTDGGDSSTAGLIIGGLIGPASGLLDIFVAALARKALAKFASTCGRCRGTGRPIRSDRRGILYQCGNCGNTWLDRRGV